MSFTKRDQQMLAEAYMLVKEDQSKSVYSEKRALGGILAAGALAASPAAARGQPDASKGFLGDLGLEKAAEVLQDLEGDLGGVADEFNKQSQDNNKEEVGKEVSSFILDIVKEATGINDALNYIDVVKKFLTDIIKLAAIYAGLGIFVKFGLSVLLKLFVEKFLIKQLDNTKDWLLKKLPNNIQQEIKKLKDLEQTNPQEFAERVEKIQKRCEANLDMKLNFISAGQWILYYINKHAGKALAATAGFKLTVLLFFCHLLVKYGVNLTSVFF